MIRALPSLLLLLAACPAPDDGKPADDTDADGDSGDTGGGGTEALGPCGAYAGYRAVGDASTFGFTDEYVAQTGYTGGYTYTVTALETADSVTTVEIEGTLTMSNSSMQMTSEMWQAVHCDAVGLYLDAMRTDTVTVIGGNIVTAWSELTYDAGFLTLPADPQVGSTWTATSSGTTETSSGSYDFDQSYEYVVTDEASVSTPAGDFTALTIDQTTEGESTSYWLERDLGLVLSSTYELTAYTR